LNPADDLLDTGAEGLSRMAAELRRVDGVMSRVEEEMNYIADGLSAIFRRSIDH